MPGWSRVFGNQDIPEPIGGLDLNKEHEAKVEKTEELTPSG